MQENDIGRLEVIEQGYLHCGPTLLNPLPKCYTLHANLAQDAFSMT